MPVSEKPRKQYKPRDKDPVRLILERGSLFKQEIQPVLDEDGTQAKDEDGQDMFTVTAVPTPKGVVLAPVQTLLVAGYIQTLQNQVQTLSAILQEHEKDGDPVVLGPTEEVEAADG